MLRSSFAALALVVLCSAGCQSNGTSSTSGDIPNIVAEINGTKITRQELEEASANDLSRVKAQIYDIHRTTLDSMIGDILLEAAAKKEGLSAEAFLKKEVDDKVAPPTEDALKAFYEQRKDQMQGKGYDEVKPQIQQFLAQSQRGQFEQQLGARLKQDSKITINLEPPRVKVDTKGAYAIGPDNAPIKLVEFTDYECPFCGRARATVNQILSTYGDKVQYVIRDFPLSFHQNSMKAHEAAYCAGDQDESKYWEMNTHLFANQRGLQMPKLKDYAKQIGLDETTFDACMASNKFQSRVQGNQAAGAAAGVSGTPAFFVNGISLSGARPFAEFQKIIDQELALKEQS